MKQETQRFQNKVVLLTGGAVGIGRTTALAFAREGAKVMVTDVDEENGQQTAKLIQEAGGQAHFFYCNVADPEHVQKMVDQTIKIFDGLDVAINNAGVEGALTSISEGTLENWDHVMGINLRGLWLCLKAEIPEMAKRGGGAIVNLSSIAGQIGFPGLSPYVASKHGVIGLTRTAALECAEQNIHVNALCPGPILTPMLERLMSTTPGFKENLIAGVPQKRIGTVEEVAQTLLFLASKDAKYITGQALGIDGGWLAQ